MGDGDLLTQVDQVVRNTLAALEAAGARPADIVRITIWVVGDDRAELAAVWTRLRAPPLAEALTSASTLVGVSVLGYAGQLVELDVTAAPVDATAP